MTPLVTGHWLVVLSPIAAAAPRLLHGGVGVYGLCLLAMAIAVHADPSTVGPKVDEGVAAAAGVR